MIGILEIEAIRRVGELIKGVGSQFTEYAEKKKKQLDAEAKKRDELVNSSRLHDASAVFSRRSGELVDAVSDKRIEPVKQD